MRPYICVFETCESTAQFESLSSWHRHMARHKRIKFYCPFHDHASTPFPTAHALQSHLEKAHAETIPSALASSLALRGARPVPDLLLSLLQDWNTELAPTPIIWPLGRRNIVLCPFCPKAYLSVNAAYGSALYNAVIERSAAYVLPKETADRIWRHLTYHLEAIALLGHPEFVMPGTGEKATAPSGQRGSVEAGPAWQRGVGQAIG